MRSVSPTTSATTASPGSSARRSRSSHRSVREPSVRQRASAESLPPTFPCLRSGSKKAIAKRMHDSLRLLFVVLMLGTANAEDIAQISFPADNSFLLDKWISDPISAEIEPLPAELREVAGKIIAAAYGKYPIEIRRKYLAGLHIVGSLRFYDVSYGGTYVPSTKEIILVYRETFNPVGFEQRFHHEFSSILLKHNEAIFETERWRHSNDPSFQYRAGGIIEEQS